MATYRIWAETAGAFETKQYANDAYAKESIRMKPYKVDILVGYEESHGVW